MILLNYLHFFVDKLTFLQTETSQNGFILTLKGSLVLSKSPWVIALCRGPMISLSMQTKRVPKSTFPTSFPWKRSNVPVHECQKGKGSALFFKNQFSIFHMFTHFPSSMEIFFNFYISSFIC